MWSRYLSFSASFVKKTPNIRSASQAGTTGLPEVAENNPSRVASAWSGVNRIQSRSSADEGWIVHLRAVTCDDEFQDRLAVRGIGEYHHVDALFRGRGAQQAQILGRHRPAVEVRARRLPQRYCPVERRLG